MKNEKSRRIALLPLVAIILLFACAPEPVVREKPVTYNPPGDLMEKAEKKIRAKDYEEASRLLNDLLFQFPDSPEADDAAMKNGLILKSAGHYGEARRLFEKLVADYPDSPYREDANFEILDTYLSEGNSEQVVEKAKEFYKPAAGRTYPPRVLSIVGDAYLNMDNPENAVRLYTMAYNRALGPEKDAILEKVKEGIGRFPLEDLEMLSEEIEDAFPKGYIMFQLGLNKKEMGKYSEATEAFEAFLTTFPGHPLAVEARGIIATIKYKTDEERYTIGCLLPLSGKYERLGQRAWDGVVLAIQEFGYRHGGAVVRIKPMDTESDPVKAVQGVRELAEGHSKAIIGPLATAEEAAREAQEKQVPMIALSLRDKITEEGDYIFRNFLTHKMQVQSLVSFLTDSLGLTRFAILYPEEAYGNVFMNLFWDQVIAKDGNVVGAESYALNLTDYKGPIKKLSGLFDDAQGEELGKRLDDLEEDYGQVFENAYGEGARTPMVDFGAIFIPDSVERAGMILPQLAYYDISGVYILGTNLWHSEKFLRMVHGYTQTVVLTDGFFAESKNPLVESFVEKFENVFGRTPGFIEAVAYDSAMIVMETMATRDVTERSRLKDLMLEVRNFPGVTGKTSFDATGEAQKEVYILRVKDGRFIELKQPGQEPSPLPELYTR